MSIELPKDPHDLFEQWSYLQSALSDFVRRWDGLIGDLRGLEIDPGADTRYWPNRNHWYRGPQFNKSGVYALYADNGKLMYIGRAVRLNARCSQHVKARRISFRWMDIIVTQNRLLIASLEEHLIRSLLPTMNVRLR